MVSDSSPHQEMVPPNVGNVQHAAGKGGANKAGSAAALAESFERHKDRLRRMVRLRLDRRLQGRIDPADMVQEAYAEMCRRVAELPSQPPPESSFLWMRKITGERLQAIHQEFFGATVDVAGQDVSLYRGALPEANSVSLAAQLLGRLTPAAQEAERAEKQLRLQEALNGMNPLDREILALRHFEELSNQEAAEVLEMTPAESSRLFIHALKRLKDIVSSIPGFLSSG
jgi:RNA polymerase sigma-70 factor, ECF subfamily